MFVKCITSCLIACMMVYPTRESCSDVQISDHGLTSAVILMSVCLSFFPTRDPRMSLMWNIVSLFLRKP